MCRWGVVNEAYVVTGREVLGHPYTRLHPTGPHCCNGNRRWGSQPMWQAGGQAMALLGVGHMDRGPASTPPGWRQITPYGWPAGGGVRPPRGGWRATLGGLAHANRLCPPPPGLEIPRGIGVNFFLSNFLKNIPAKGGYYLGPPKLKWGEWSPTPHSYLIAS